MKPARPVSSPEDALAQRIVERHGGEIRCESAPGQGCRVVFTLPVDGGPGTLP